MVGYEFVDFRCVLRLLCWLGMLFACFSFYSVVVLFLLILGVFALLRVICSCLLVLVISALVLIVGALGLIQYAVVNFVLL